MTIARFLTTLQTRIARSHTTGGLTAVARELGISKERLHRWLSGMDVPPPAVIAALGTKLTKRKG